LNQGLDPNLYFFRDNHKNEVDLLYKKAHELIPIEIKSAKSFDRTFLKGLNFIRKLIADRVPTGYLIYAGSMSYDIDGFHLLNYKSAHQIVG